MFFISIRKTCSFCCLTRVTHFLCFMDNRRKFARITAGVIHRIYTYRYVCIDVYLHIPIHILFYGPWKQSVVLKRNIWKKKRRTTLQRRSDRKRTLAILQRVPSVNGAAGAACFVFGKRYFTWSNKLSVRKKIKNINNFQYKLDGIPVLYIIVFPGGFKIKILKKNMK